MLWELGFKIGLEFTVKWKLDYYNASLVNVLGN